MWTPLGARLTPCPALPPLLQDTDSLPLLTAPHDALREGLVTLKDAATSAHPVEAIQKARSKSEEQSQLEMLEKVYGSALPARMQIERQILNRCGGEAAEEWEGGGSELQAGRQAGRRQRIRPAAALHPHPPAP